MRRPRPWRAAAYIDLGGSRYYSSHTSACSREGLQRFVDEYEANGHIVLVWEVRPIPEVEQAAATAPSPPVPSAP